MNVKSLMLLLALAGLGAGCSDDETSGGGTSGIAGRSELQIVFSGSGESQSYDKKTKAIATAKENQIDDLQIYLFASASEAGPYYYLETWQDGTAYDPEHPENTNFKKTEAGTGWKASLYPNELGGVPYIKLFCIANKNVAGVLASDNATPSQTTDEKFYKEDGATEILTALTPVTTKQNADGTYTVTPGTTEADFIASYTKVLGAAADGVISTPLLMTGQGKTKISGSVSKVDIDLTRIAARFDIDNTTSKSNLTIKKITLAQGRKTAPLWKGTPITKVEKDDLATSTLIAQKYETVDFEKLTGANQGVTESSLYVYPTLATDESYLILEGTYKSPVNSSQVPVTYHVPIVRTPEDGDKGEYIAINANNRYCLRITDVTLSNVYGTFDVVDWTSAGGITIRPDNDAPVFAGEPAFKGANKPKDLNALNPEATTFDYEVTGDADGKGEFSLEIAATGAVRCEKETVSNTKAGETDWLTISTDKTEERDGVWYTTFKFEYTNSIGQQPVAVHFINETASYDPALWTTINFYGPKAVPSFALVDKGNSKGNITELTDGDPKKPTATIYSVDGSYVTFDITSIEGVEVDALTGYKAEKIATNGFVHTFKISVDAQATAAGGNMIFKNAGDPTKTTTLTIKKADPSLSVAKGADAKAAIDYVPGAETPFVTTGTLQVDLDLLAKGTASFKVNSPQGLTVASLDCPWLTITQVHEWNDSDDNRYTEYELKQKDAPTNTDDFKLSFTSALAEQGIEAPGFTLTLNKAYSKPKILINDDETTYPNSSYNDGYPTGFPYNVIANMYKTDNSTIFVRITCSETITAESDNANVSVTRQGKTDYYKIEVTDATGAPDEVTITAKNTNDANRKAIVTLTLIDPAVELKNPTGKVPPILSGTTVTIPSSYAQYDMVRFDIMAPKGSSVTCPTGDWFTSNPSGTAIIDESNKLTMVLNGEDQTTTPNVTFTVHNSVTEQDETITITKEVAAP